MEVTKESVTTWLNAQIAKWQQQDGIGRFYVDAYLTMKSEFLGDTQAAKALEWNDDTPMPFGKHKDSKLGDVPDDYLDWCYKQDWIEKWPKLVDYIERVQNKQSTAAPTPAPATHTPTVPIPPASIHNTPAAAVTADGVEEQEF